MQFLFTYAILVFVFLCSVCDLADSVICYDYYGVGLNKENCETSKFHESYDGRFCYSLIFPGKLELRETEAKESLFPR